MATSGETAAARQLHRYVYLNEAGRRGLNAYKYQSGSVTPLDKLLNHFWEWAVTLVPLWVAPNLITLLGLMFNVVGCAAMVAFAPAMGACAGATTRAGCAPGWCARGCFARASFGSGVGG
jgi:ethanolaminephosphotransferase